MLKRKINLTYLNFRYLFFIMFVPTPLLAHNLTVSCPNKQITFQVALAENPQQWKKGLMGQKSLEDNEGMLFLFPQPKASAMWMQNTPISLDMIFANEAGKILAIKENAIPFSLETIGPVNNTTQVLEIKGGMVEKHNISTKCRLKFNR
jgi:uncharacterized membrane protein (UPF0127 family)